MTIIGTHYELSSRPQPVRRRKVPLPTLLGSAALTFIAVACSWTLYVNVAGPEVKPVAFADPAPAPRPVYSALSDPTYFQPAPETFAEALPKGDKLPVNRPIQQAQAAPEAAPFQVATTAPVAPVADQQAETTAAPAQAAAVPLPVPRPAQIKVAEEKGPSRREVAEATTANLPAKPPEQPSIFEKLFGKLRPTGPMLAYAPTDGGVTSDGTSGPPYDKQTAVYDISARTVYMPDGTKLEAHSGLGSRLDDPRFVHERMRGATPPHVYELTMREKLFHGVPAIRLNPVGGNSHIYGRTGLLAHTNMLGPRGDSNGCVSFRDYNAFLKAFRNGEVKRLAVVASLKS
jgi:hypothetical protein